MKTIFETDKAAAFAPEIIRDMILGLDTLVPLSDGSMVPAVNLDNAATTPPFKAVAEEIQKALLYYGSIGRGKGQKSDYSSKIYTDGRDAVKAFAGAESEKYTVFYASCTTDGMNKLASALITDPEDLVLTTRMEHHANDLPWRERARTLHAEVDEDGRLSISDLERILSENNGNIKYVTVTAASNVTGYVNDVHRIAGIAHRHGAQIIVDGAQIVAHRSFSMLGDTPEEDIDYFVFSAHKMYSPYGGGAVIGLTLELCKHIPVFYGGGMVKTVYDESVKYTTPPDLYEAGSPNYPGVVGMLKAIKLLQWIGFDYIKEHEQRLLKRAISGLKEIPGVILYGDNENFEDRVGIIVFNLEGIENEVVADRLAGYSAISVRHAAFCAHTYVRRLTHEDESGPYKEPVDICIPPQGMVRVSFGIYNNEADVDTLISTIKKFMEDGSHMTLKSGAEAASLSEDKIAAPNDRG